MLAADFLYQLSDPFNVNGDGKFHQNLCGDGGILDKSAGGLQSMHFDHLISKETKRKPEQDRFSQVSELMKVSYIE